VARLHHTGADTHEEYTVFFVLRVELGHNQVQARLRGSVQSTSLELQIVGHIKVSQTGGNGNDLLNLTLQYEREEEVEEMNVANDIGLP
jgi:hypothetical protein